jgi:hypothetical protein
MTAGYVEDIRSLKRTKAEAKAKWLVWRKGKFSSSEIDSIKNGFESWLDDTCGETSSSREEVLESLKWSKDNKMTAWCDIATRVSLPERKIGAIRHCILRRLLPGSEKSRWTKAETDEFIRLQEAYGATAWKQIAQETGRTLEDVANKGRQIAQTRASQTSRSTKFSREETLRVKLAKLIKEGMGSKSYEISAIRADCILVAFIRRYVFPDGSFERVHDMPNVKLAKKLNILPVDVRIRWHQKILPELINRVTMKLDDHNIMDAFLILRLRKACRGELIDENGIQIFPCGDWCSINWQHLMPMWPQTVTENRMRHILRAQPKFDLIPLPEVVELTGKALIQTRSKSEIYKSATVHFEELRRLLNLIADKGEEYLSEET